MFNNLLKNKHINKVVLFFISLVFIFDSKKRREINSKIKNIYRNSKKKQIANLIQKNYFDGYCIFSRYGIGDIFFIASLLKEFKQKNKGKIIYFTEKKSLVKFLQAFPSIDKVVYDKDIKFLQEEQTLQQHVSLGKLNKLFFPYRGTKSTYTFSDNYNNLLDVPLNAHRELPTIKETNYDNAKKEFSKLKIRKSKTILIIPEATMFDYRIIDSNFWQKLADNLIGKGYDVVFNSKSSDYKKYKNTFLPIMDFMAFVQQVKYVISFRSGISDLIAGMGNYNLSVLYPPNLEVIWADAIMFHDLHKNHIQNNDNEFDNMFSIHSLNNTFKTNLIDEIIYNYDDENIIKQIIGRCNNEI